jgi:small-conductance mechanosensitive channel
MQQLVDLIAEKEAALSQVETILTGQLDELNLLKTELLEQMDLFSEKIDKKRTQERFERRAYAHDFPVWKTLTAELQDVRSQIRQIPRRDLWIGKLSQIWQKGGLLLLAAGSLYIFLMIYLYRIKRLCAKLKASPFCIEFPWRSLAIRILNKSLMLIGTIVFIVVYSQLRGFYTTSTAVQLVVHFLTIFLYTGWGLSLINIWLKQPPSAISTAILHRLRVLVLAIRYTALIYIGFDWLLGGDAVLLTLIRLSFEVYLIFWIIAFKKYWQRDFRAPNPKVAGTLKTLERVILWGAYTIAAIPLVLDFVGYGPLAAYWLTAIGYSVVVIFWAVIFYFMLREWDQKFYTRQADGADKPAQPIKWLLFRLCWLVWGLVVILLLGFAWVGHATAIQEIVWITRHKIKFGEFELSLLGALNVFLVLFFTHIIVRLWRHTLHKKILDESGLETGLKNSIVSINVYILWSLGILVALYAFGVSGTSLTVAFGALSIGLGFGLQNIFNNFISGIIMLFERPIQVGDAIEINGIWGEVKKINFRSTVIQTYDNASLIIPNSDFISNPVTNWSFRDKSLRIKIDVGVAYGSDLDLVKETLLEVAARTPKVRKYPKPDVLFQDFADSALIFTLRVWTDIDNMLIVGTAIRFEIDKIFKQRNITIPFPQRDLHLRSATGAPTTALSEGQAG